MTNGDYCCRSVISQNYAWLQGILIFCFKSHVAMHLINPYSQYFTKSQKVFKALSILFQFLIFFQIELRCMHKNLSHISYKFFSLSLLQIKYSPKGFFICKFKHFFKFSKVYALSFSGFFNYFEIFKQKC